MSFKGTAFGFVIAISSLLAFAKAYAEEPSLPAPPDIEDLGLMPDTGLKSKQETAKEESDALKSLDSEKDAADSLGDPDAVSAPKGQVEIEEGEIAPPPVPKAKKDGKKSESAKEEEMAAPPDVPAAPAAASASEEIPAPPEEKASSSMEENTDNKIGKYMVVKGDSLWGISGMGSTYGNSFQWPLIFRANRDNITDPDLIYPEQNFSIRHDFSEEDVKKAVEDASKTPPYVPHTKPRETLPVDYF